MNQPLISKFDLLPNEIILEIYRYLHCGHVLYGFYDINVRFNNTITDYCHHVILRRLNYKQFLYLYSFVLPRIGTLIISLTINRLQQPYFLNMFSLKMNQVFPNLRRLALDDWRNQELFSFVANHLNQLAYLRTIIIRGLRKTNSQHQTPCTVDDKKHLVELTRNNTQIECIYFEPDCYSMTLLNNPEHVSTYSNLIELTISLTTSNDLISLAVLVPNIRRLHVIIEELMPINVDIVPFQCLTHFSLDAIEISTKLDYVIPILRLIPTVEQISLTLTSTDERLIYGHHLLAFLSSGLFINKHLLESLRYAVYFSTFTDFSLDSKTLLESWDPIPMTYTINKQDKRSYILIHTLPYPSILLNLHSILASKFSLCVNGNHMYDNVQYLCICRAQSLHETFKIIQHCRKIQDLNIQIDARNMTLPVVSNNEDKQVIKLPRLKKLEILSVFGIVDDWQHFSTLLKAAHNISTLCIDLDCAIKLFENVNENSIFPRVLHLFIDGNNSNIKFNNEHIFCLSKIFDGIHSLKIKYKKDSLIEANIVGSIVDNCKQLIVFTINGQIPETISKSDLQNWIVKYSFRLQNSDKTYQVDLCDSWFQIWL